MDWPTAFAIVGGIWGVVWFLHGCVNRIADIEKYDTDSKNYYEYATWKTGPEDHSECSDACMQSPKYKARSPKP